MLLESLFPPQLGWTGFRAHENMVSTKWKFTFVTIFILFIFINFDELRTESFDSENMRDLVDVYLREMQTSPSPDFHGNMLEVNSSWVYWVPTFLLPATQSSCTEYLKLHKNTLKIASRTLQERRGKLQGFIHDCCPAVFCSSSFTHKSKHHWDIYSRYQTEKIETEVEDVDRIRAYRCTQLCQGFLLRHPIHIISYTISTLQTAPPQEQFPDGEFCTG